MRATIDRLRMSPIMRLFPELQAAPFASRTVLFVIAPLLSIAGGFAAVFVEPVFFVGAILGVVFILILLREPFVGLLLYLLLFILRLGEIYPVLAPLRLERIMGVLTLGSMLLRQIYYDGKVSFDSTRQSKLMLWIVIAAACSIPMAYWRYAAIQGTITFLKILIFYVLIVHLVDTRRRLWIFVSVYLALICYLAGSAFFNYIKGSILVAQGIDRAVGSTSAGGGPNEMGATMATTIPFLLLLGFHPRLRRWRVWLLALMVLLTITLVITGSRSGLLGFVGGMGILWWRSRHKILFAILGLILAGAGFSVMPEQYKGRYSTITQSELDGSSQARLHVWMKGLHMVASRPLTGVGVDCFGTANAMSFSTGGRRSFLESHSLYVQVPAEMGLFGALVFFSFIYTYMRANRRTSQLLEEDEEDWGLEQTLLLAIFTGAVVLLVTGVFGHSLMRRTWYMYAALGLSTLRIYQHRLESRVATHRSEPEEVSGEGGESLAR